MQPTLAPSLLSANFADLEDDLEILEEVGCTHLHIDVMDGHFVPNISFGPVVVQAIRPLTKMFFDVHLMISHPAQYIEAFAKAGADNITFHYESNDDVEHTIALIKHFGKKCGIVIKPATSIEFLTPYIDAIDLILIMSVEPGFGGQSFMPEMLAKVEQARELVKGKDIIIEIDGGITANNIESAVKSGAELIVAGTSVFGHPGGIQGGYKALEEKIK